MSAISPSANNVTKIKAGISFRTSPEATRIGFNKAVNPRMSARFVMLEPSAFPSASPGLPSTAENTDTATSGAEVPKPTTTMPTTSADTPRRREIAAAPATNQPALHSSRAIPPST